MKRGFVCLALLILVVGCNRPPSRDRGITELEDIDIGAAPDAELSTELDEQGRRIAIEVSGVLPTDVPLDVPIHSPSSLIDFGEVDEQRRYVAVDTSAGMSTVRGRLVSELGTQGWALASEEESKLEFSKAGRSLVVVVEDLKPGTRLRYEYKPR